ncbi:cytochrome c oxidase subunit 3 [Paraglaciecola sp. MB-3u-78]|uniref:cytochrome c oxidase subunit 3 n=1 Tax=Paraglaciecola sp. MB-3u-78 TaxID=2058332 RepID=UPI000C33B198|nr:cytochrome c oxidase subunit 3 [Paraglaciecola sp. MB-3u-78]PKG97270.1 cytochrome c oxidase subunit III [Paraglaciecola sp. MB-3u-78]
MSFLAPLMEKPWEQAGAPQQQGLGREHTRKAGLRLLLAVVSVLFLLFIVAFLMRSQYPDWQPLAETSSNPLFNKSILWLNSFYLLAASICMQVARVNARPQNRLFLHFGLILAGLFSAAFVTGQLMFWQQLYQQGFVVNANPALSFFYIFTGLHAVHVGIGLLAWLVALTAMLRNSPKLSQYIDLCAIYWHFLFGLWLLLFALLVSKPEKYNAIVEFCGLGA